MDIKVEPLNPGIFSVQSSGSTDRMRVPIKTEDDSALYHQVSDYSVSPQQSDTSYKYQSTSMPVFPNMPYSSAYPYVPIRPAPSQTAQVSSQYTSATSGTPDPYDVEEEAAFEEKVPRNSTGIIGKRSHLPKRYKCAMCAYRTRYKSDLNRHVRKHAIATFNCDICNMPFKTVGNVEFHKRKEHSGLLTNRNKTPANEIIKYSCKMCPYGSQYSSDLTRHVRKHYVAKFHCSICNKPFMTSGSLASHKRTVHDIKESDDADTSSLAAHDGNSESDFDSADLSVDVNGNDKEDLEFDEDEMKDDSGDKQDDSVIVVSENSYSYEEPDIEPTPMVEGINMSSSNTASEKHSNAEDSKHSCPYCNKTFGRKLVLDHHMKNVHRLNSEENGDFVNYNKDYDLALDMSIQEMENSPVEPPRAPPTNTGPLRHKCPFCAYATNYKSTYDRHVRKHELLCHICNVCRMPFITFGHLQRHIRDNHPDHNQQISKKEVTIEKQTCSYCDFEADSLEQLRIHCEGKHGQVIAQEIHRSGSKKTHGKVPNTSVISNLTPEAQSSNGSKAIYANTTSERPDPSPEKPVIQGHKDMPMLYNVPKSESQMEEGVYSYPPTSGRYAKLISDFDDFAAKPFACALCFFRCSDVHTLITHAENHLTGCNPFQVPETARFTSGHDGTSDNTDISRYKGPAEKAASVVSDINKPVFPTPVPVQMNCTLSNSSIACRTSPVPVSESSNVTTHIKREPSSNRRKSSMPTRLTQAPQSPVKSTKYFKDLQATKLNIDRLIPTFSVHYRKDKTNPAKPYLCLMCRKRFRHLPMLKQHFRQVHNENGSVNNQKFECEPCSLTFNTPMAFQEHHEIHH